MSKSGRIVKRGIAGKSSSSGTSGSDGWTRLRSCWNSKAGIHGNAKGCSHPCIRNADE
jgi:hypothetical protein